MEQAEILDPVWSSEQLERLSDWLKVATGIDLCSYKQPYVHRRLQSRMRKLRLTAAEDYLQRLQQQQGEPEALIDALTVNVTQFFRNPSTFEGLERLVYPVLFKAARPGRPVRIWSLGCAGGEEPFSIALQLAHHRTYRHRFRILATDVAKAVLDQARDAVFEETALSSIPEPYRSECVSLGDGTFRLPPRISQSVRFRRQDILELERYPISDLVLCRNVLIYFDRSRQTQIVEKLAESLAEGGFLILGRAETLSRDTRDLFQCVDSAERIYQKV